MYEEFIQKWFEKRKTPNHQFDILKITSIILGYYDEVFQEESLEQEAKVYVIETLKSLGFSKTSKRIILSDGTELPCYFNISLRKIKEALKPLIKKGEVYLTGYLHSRKELYKIGYLLRLSEKGLNLKKESE